MCVCWGEGEGEGEGERGRERGRGEYLTIRKRMDDLSIELQCVHI